MGLFSKTPKPNPKIVAEGIEIEFHRDHEWWSFTYRGTVFSSYELSFTLPRKEEIDAILATVESLKPEMELRLKNGPDESGGVQLGEGESYVVDANQFATDGTFVVSWSGGTSWGDMGIDFTIKGNAIIDEGWGD